MLSCIPETKVWIGGYGYQSVDDGFYVIICDDFLDFIGNDKDANFKNCKGVVDTMFRPI